MGYEVLARKWRPQQFDDVVGQQHVTQTLKNAIQSGRVAHAYLFVGPRGVGKTSLARIFAKALNCKTGPTVTPCDRCDMCREIMAGNSMDVLEVDGASNNGVDQIRDLRDNVKYAPARGAFKIYIIDEVHMLSTQAFNALLKTLEEPPPHVKFVFATTEPQKVLPTILSRCQRFDLRRIPSALIVQRLKEVAAAEKVRLSEDAVLAIARGAEGGMRDAESALDQLIAFRGATIEEADVLSVFGLASRHTLERLTDAILDGDVGTLVATVAELDESGKDMQRLVLELIDHFRNILVVSAAPREAQRLDIVEGQLAKLGEQARRVPAERIVRISDVLTTTEGRLRYALSKRTLLETALIRCARAATVVSLDEVLSQLLELKRQIGADEAAPMESATARPAPVAPAPAERRRAAVADTAADGETDEPDAPVDVAEEAAPAPRGLSSEAELDLLTARWHEIAEGVGRRASLAKGPLLDGKPVRVEGRTVEIAFAAEFASSAARLKAGRFRMALQTVLQEVLGRPVQAEFVVIGVEGAAPAEPAPPAARSRKDIVEDPTVRRTLEVFKGKITEIRD